MRISVVVAHYAARGTSHLQRLCEQMSQVNAGCEYDIVIVSNIDLPPKAPGQVTTADQAALLREASIELWPKIKASTITLLASSARESRADLHKTSALRWLARPNIGMNLGAWDAGWRLCAEHRSDKEADEHHFLFLQDEVEIQRESWLFGFVNRLDELRNGQSTFNGEIKPILLGETWNHRWDQPWEVLRGSAINRPEYLGGETMGLGRVDFYLGCFKDWSVKAQQTGGHLRALVMFSDLATLKRINGFHIGESKQSCIASEIALSQAVLERGGEVAQVKALEPFHYLWHREWRKDGSSKASISNG